MRLELEIMSSNRAGTGAVDGWGEVDDGGDETWVTVPSNVFPRVLVHAEDSHSVEMPVLLVDRCFTAKMATALIASQPTPNALATAEIDILSTARQCRIHLVVDRVMAAFGVVTGRCAGQTP
ncbi:hypothetical protein [Rhodococcus erythropolis]|uniref:hypothetical protein n=1 Tax=Rhodococcus erythropolis TaxID=1833 RepID=UPI00366F36FB